MAMNRRIGIGERVKRVSQNGVHWYIDPIMGIDSEKFDRVEDREAEIALHYREPGECRHDWEEVTRKRNYYEPGMCSGIQRCTRCGAQSEYQKEID